MKNEELLVTQKSYSQFKNNYRGTHGILMYFSVRTVIPTIQHPLKGYVIVNPKDNENPRIVEEKNSVWVK